MPDKQISYQKVLRIMEMEDSVVNITPRIFQKLVDETVVARAYLDITVLHKEFLYTSETNINSERYFVRSDVKGNIPISRNGLRSFTLEELLLSERSYITEDKMKLSMTIVRSY